MINSNVCIGMALARGNVHDKRNRSRKYKRLYLPPSCSKPGKLKALQLDPANVAPEEAETVFRHMRPDSVLTKQGSGPFSYTYQARMAKQ